MSILDRVAVDGSRGVRLGWPGWRAAALAAALCAGLVSDATAQDGVETDRAALAALYDATGGPGWTDSTNWKTSAPLGEWYGVTTDAAGRVTRLELRENGLSGRLPAQLGDLSNLRWLRLGSNELAGSIPSALGRLANLEGLLLDRNALTGPVPAWLGNLTSLRALGLGSNELAGSIPSALGRLANLDWLSLWGNALTGPVPAWLGNLTSLRSLDLGGNELTGSIPPELGRLANLEWLSLWRNALAGPVPAWLGNLTGLRSLSLGGNELTGAIPPELSRLANLERLSLWGNALTGPVPAWLGNLTGLRSLDLGGNELTGSIPSALGRLANLEWLSLWGNALTGPVPAWLGNLTSLRSLDLGGNELTGAIPPELGRLVSLEWLSFGGNALTGPVPAWLGNLASLRSLDLGGNDLTGAIPSALGRLANLERLSLGRNALTGPVPAWLGDLTGLQALRLDGNDLTGPIPSELGRLENLEGLFLAWNPLTGPLPRSLAGLSQLTRLDIDRTGACAPADAEFQAWLATIDFKGDTCNRPPEPVGAIPAQVLSASGPAIGVSVEAYFSDPDDDPLTYAAASSNAGAVAVLVSGGTVWLVPGTRGAATVTVTARDPDGLSATQTVDATTGASDGPRSDREVLEAFHDSTGGTDWTDNTNWKTSAPLDQWHGVTTDAGGRVTQLILPSNGLTGPVPAWLGNLTGLRAIELGGNDLTGPIPSELGRLANLEGLSLTGNALTGPVPAWLGNLTGLRWLNLDGNELTGPIPPELGRLSNLDRLSLGWNELTGPIPDALGRLANLEQMYLSENALTGPVPAWLGNLTGLRWLYLGGNDLTGPIPDALGRLENLEQLDLSYNWGLSGPPPAGLEQSPLERLDIFATQACAPAASRAWLETIEFKGPMCGSGTDATIDVVVVYTPAAREEAGGAAEIAAVIDLMIAETNQAFAESGVGHRVALVASSEVSYTEAGDGRDIDRLADPSDGYMDEVHAMRDRSGADLVHLIFKWQDHPFGGVAHLAGAFGLTCQHCGGDVFAHELGHNMGLRHDRHAQLYSELGRGPVTADPAFGYVNQRAFVAGAARSSRWRTIMSYGTQCEDAYTSCSWLLRFSNSRQSYGADPMGVAYGDGAGVAGPADAAAVLNVTGPAMTRWRDRPAGANRRPVAAGTLPDRALTLGATLGVDVSQAFVDPDGDVLSYAVSSSAPSVASVAAAGARLTVTAVAEGAAMIRVTARDPGGLSAAQLFAVTVDPAPNRPPEAAGVLGPLTLGLDDPASSVEVGGAFRDPDGDVLTYGAVSSAPSVASVSMSGARLTVTGVAEGAAVVTVTATDPGGLSASQSFGVTVGPAPNRAPEAVEVLGPLALGLDDPAMSVAVGGAFRDPDGDVLTYGAVSSAPSVASVSVSGARLTVTAVGEGAAVVTVTATDPGGLSASQSFGVTVGPASNRPPEAAGVLGPLALGLDDPATSVAVGGAFRDPDGDVLTYGAVSSAPSVASVSVSGARLTVTAVGEGAAVVTVTATDPGGLSAAQTFTVTVSRSSNRAPEAVGVLGPLTLGLDDGASLVDVGAAFRDPDGDELTYGAASSAPSVASVSVSGSVVTVTPAGAGTAVVTVTATDAAGSNKAATQTFRVRVLRPFTDHPIVPGVTPIRAVHFTELRVRIDGLRAEAGLPGFAWTDPALTAGVTAVRLVHLTELREALAAAYRAGGRSAPLWTDDAPRPGTTPIRAAHLNELRAAVRALE